MIRTRFCQFIRVALLGLTLGLPIVARADIAAVSDADSPASDTPPTTEPMSSDIPSPAFSSDPLPEFTIPELLSFDTIEDLIDPWFAPSLLDDLVEDLSGDKLDSLEADDMDPTPGVSSFLLWDGLGMPDCHVVPIPEPGSLALWTLAAAGIAGYRRLRSQKPSRA